MREAFQSEGEVASLDLLAALCAMGREGSTGRAVFTRGEERVVFVVDRGVLVDLEAPADSSVSDVLIRSGKLQRETYEALVIPSGENRFAVATASGVVSRKEAAWGRKLSAIESLGRLLSWTEGNYTFDPLAPDSPPGFRLPIDKWILELFLRSNDRALVVSRIGPTDLPLKKSDDFAPAFAALGLTADADAVAALVDGQRSVEEIARKSRTDEFAVLKLLAALISLGLVRPSYETMDAPVPEEIPPAIEAAAEPEPFPIEPDEAGPGLEPVRDALAEPISLPLFALTAPEEPAELAAATRLQESVPENEETPAAAATPLKSRGRWGTLAAVLFAAAGAAAFWWVSRRSTAPAPPPRIATVEERPKAEPPAAAIIPRSEPPAKPPAKTPAPPPARAAAPMPAPRTRREDAPWKKNLEKGRRAFEHPGEYAYSIQLELACEDSTVAKALRADPSGRRIWIVPFGYRGRNCYRVLWGRYTTLARAKDAKASIPGIFLRAGNRPAVISLPGEGKSPR